MISLVVLAAGMGSRYGGLKQLDPMDEKGHVLLEFSVYDALRAGFDDVIFVIKESFHEAFHEKIGAQIAKHVPVRYVFQDSNTLPKGYSVNRTKPLGTGHALYCAKEVLVNPFMVINADDYYGVDAYAKVAQFLKANDEPSRHCMIGYPIQATLSRDGSVSRGVCRVNDHELVTIEEHTKLIQDGARIVDEATHPATAVPSDCLVSMNCWGFMPSFVDLIKADMVQFLDEIYPQNVEKSEFFLPSIVGDHLKHECSVTVIPTTDSWFGVTYPTDKIKVLHEVESLKEKGVYPEYLWNKHENI